MIPQTVTSRTDDRILGSTRVVAALIIPFLVAAFVILYLLPDSTDRLFAWMIMPRMSALLMGAGYASGIYFFTRVLRAQSSDHAVVSFPTGLGIPDGRRPFRFFTALPVGRKRSSSDHRSHPWPRASSSRRRRQ